MPPQHFTIHRLSFKLNGFAKNGSWPKTPSVAYFSTNVGSKLKHCTHTLRRQYRAQYSIQPRAPIYNVYPTFDVIRAGDRESGKAS
jgi:hypothetical protein